MTSEETRKSVNTIMASLQAFRDIMIIRNPGFNLGTLQPLFVALMMELRDQGRAIIQDSIDAEVPRQPREVLEEINRRKEIDQKLLQEIKKIVEG